MTASQPVSMASAYALAMSPWGGLTIRQSDQRAVSPASGYAVSVTDARTLTIPDSATYAQFVAAWDQASARFASAPYLGVFHDSDAGTIDFDGTVIVPTRGAVDALYRAGNPVRGGAYDFATGNGYWPGRQPASQTTA